MSESWPSLPLSDEILCELDRQGFVPGPDESEQAFTERVREALRFAEELPIELAKQGSDFPFSPEDSIPPDHRAEALDAVEEFYGIRPEWVPAYYASEGLSPWHGGGTWVVELEGYKQPVTLFQLRASFRDRKRYMRLYQRDELLTHEYCHVGRAAFDESAFEEILSYHSSRNAFRKRWGGIFESNVEVMFFFLLLVGAIVFPTFVEIWESLEPLLLPVMLLPFGAALAGVARLFWRHRSFKRCLDRLGELSDHPLAVIYRMTDGEIRSFSKLSPEELREKIDALAKESLRWRVIRLRFLHSF